MFCALYIYAALTLGAARAEGPPPLLHRPSLADRLLLRKIDPQAIELWRPEMKGEPRDFLFTKEEGDLRFAILVQNAFVPNRRPYEIDYLIQYRPGAWARRLGRQPGESRSRDAGEIFYDRVAAALEDFMDTPRGRMTINAYRDPQDPEPRALLHIGPGMMPWHFPLNDLTLRLNSPEKARYSYWLWLPHRGKLKVYPVRVRAPDFCDERLDPYGLHPWLGRDPS